MAAVFSTQWIARCAARLGERWTTVPTSELEEGAIVPWQDLQLRPLKPARAAAKCLRLLACRVRPERLAAFNRLSSRGDAPTITMHTSALLLNFLSLDEFIQ